MMVDVDSHKAVRNGSLSPLTIVNPFTILFLWLDIEMNYNASTEVW